MRRLNHFSALSSSLSLVILLLAGCNLPPPPGYSTDLASVDPAWADLSAVGPQGCTGCTAGQVCVDAACVNVPASCPCPKETYCDLAGNRCKVGCLTDTECSIGRICNDATRSCQAGCRNDAGCAAGLICDGILCRAGCRMDANCGSGRICALPANSCVAGCRHDSDCGSSTICDPASSTCQKGCRKDVDCTNDGEICDTAASMCRPGCRATSACLYEQICDTVNSKCIAGCDGDSRCNTGRICEAAMCTTGCRSNSDCATNTYCDTVTTKKCLPGCNHDKTRCIIGEACVDFVDGSSKCQAACSGYACNGSDWGCFEQGMDSHGAHCRQICSVDGDCSGGKRCTLFTTNQANPGSGSVKYCALPCTTAGCATCSDLTGRVGPGTCNTTTKACTTSFGFFTCYQTVPTYGL